MAKIRAYLAQNFMQTVYHIDSSNSRLVKLLRTDGMFKFSNVHRLLAVSQDGHASEEIERSERNALSCPAELRLD